MFMRGLGREGPERQRESADEGRRIRVAKLPAEPELESIPPRCSCTGWSEQNPIKTVKPPPPRWSPPT